MTTKSDDLSVQARSGARRRQATQADIVDATRRLILAGESIGAVSMDRIAKEAEVSRATVYLHFQDKTDIMARLAEEIVEQRFALGAEALGDPHIGREVLDRIIVDMVDRWVTDAPLLDAIIEFAEQDEKMREIWVAAIHEVGALGAQLMRERWGDGPSAHRDPGTIGQVLAWMFERATHQLTGEPERRAEVTEAIAEVVWRVFEYRGSPS